MKNEDLGFIAGAMFGALTLFAGLKLVSAPRNTSPKNKKAPRYGRRGILTGQRGILVPITSGRA